MHFGTKEEHNERRNKAFLALSPSERFQWFLRSFDEGPRVQRETNKNNFVLEKWNKDGVRGGGSAPADGGDQ